MSTSSGLGDNFDINDILECTITQGIYVSAMKHVSMIELTLLFSRPVIQCCCH